MDETTGAIVGHTHGVYGNYGNGYGYGNGNYGQNDSCVQSQINQLADQVSANGIREAVNSVGNNVVNGTASVKDTVNGVNQNVTNGNYTTLTGLNALGRDVVNAIDKSASDTMAGFNNSNIATLTGFNTTNGQIAEHFGQTFLQLKDLQASMERCCCDIRTEAFKNTCDIKEVVRVENSQTREQMTNYRILELERKLNDEKSDNSNLRQTNVLLKAIGKISVED